MCCADYKLTMEKVETPEMWESMSSTERLASAHLFFSCIVEWESAAGSMELKLEYLLSHTSIV